LDLLQTLPKLFRELLSLAAWRPPGGAGAGSEGQGRVGPPRRAWQGGQGDIAEFRPRTRNASPPTKNSALNYGFRKLEEVTLSTVHRMLFDIV